VLGQPLVQMATVQLSVQLLGQTALEQAASRTELVQMPEVGQTSYSMQVARKVPALELLWFDQMKIGVQTALPPERRLGQMGLALGPAQTKLAGRTEQRVLARTERALA
jgi:hypothetical protein